MDRRTSASLYTRIASLLFNEQEQLDMLVGVIIDEVMKSRKRAKEIRKEEQAARKKEQAASKPRRNKRQPNEKQEYFRTNPPKRARRPAPLREPDLGQCTHEDDDGLCPRPAKFCYKITRLCSVHLEQP